MKKLKSILLIPLFFQAIYGQTQSTAEKYFEQGKEAKSLNDNEKAIEYYSKAIETDTLYFKAYFNRGSILAELQDYKNALLDFIIVDNLFPNFNQNIYLLSVCYYYLGEKEKSKILIEKSLSLDTLFFDAQKFKGVIYLEENNYTIGLNAFVVAAKLNPNDYEVWYLKGFCFQELKQNEEALNSYLKSEKLGAKSAEIFNNIGHLYFTSKQNKNALEYFDKSIKVNPQYALAYYNKGLVLYNMDKINEAIENWKIAKELGWIEFNKTSLELLD